MTEIKSRIETWRRFIKKFGHEVVMKIIDTTLKKWKEVGSVQDQFFPTVNFCPELENGHLEWVYRKCVVARGGVFE